MREGGIWKGLRLYRTVITRNIVLFMAIGIINIFFADSGFFPNIRMQLLAQVIYKTALPLVIGYMVGRECGAEVGAMAGVIAVSGILLSDCGAVIIGAVIVAALSGWAAARGYDAFRDRLPSAGNMLGRNIWIVATGMAGVWLGMGVVAPALNVISRNILWALELLEKNQMMFLSGILVEPVKLLYLNNDLNHGLLIPLGMEQVQHSGSSMLFLLETNPGPGLGVLMAVLLCKRERKKEMTSAILAQTVGGIHEIYFPVVLADLRLTAALIAGGMAGTVWCSAVNAGLAGPVSPGSALTIFLMAEPGSRMRVMGAVLLSAAVSCAAAVAIMGLSAKRLDGVSEDDFENIPENVPEKITVEEQKSVKEPAKESAEEPVTVAASEISGTPITQIYVVCAAGLGSSAMGASLFRRTLKRMEITGIQVAAAPADHIPEDAQLILCQKEYVRGISGMSVPVIPVENLMNQEAYEQIIRDLRKEGRIG